MAYDVDVSQLLLGASGLTIPVGYDDIPRWLIISNNNILGNATGTTVTVSPTPADGPTREVAYGEVRHYHLAKGLRWLSVQGNGANVSLVVAFEDVPMTVSTVQVASSSGTENVMVTNAIKITPLSNMITSGNLAPLQVAENTAETVQVTGSTALATGQQVQYDISAEPVVNVAAASEVIQYIAIKGHTSGNYYAVAFVGTKSSGSFSVTSAEKLDIVTRNSSMATGIVVSCYWQAMSN